LSFRPTERSEGSGEINAKRFILVFSGKSLRVDPSLLPQKECRLFRDDNLAMLMPGRGATCRVTR
jgi:hypothetical protein